MSTACSLLTEDQFLCPVCHNVFTDPVCTPCGHNFCKSCITEDVNGDVPLECPVCHKMFYPKPELQVNTLLAKMVSVFRQSADGRSFKQQAVDLVNLIAVVLCVIWACRLILYPQIYPDFPLTEESGDKTTEESMEKQRTTEILMKELQENMFEMKKVSAAQMEQMFTDVMKKETPKLLIRAELMRARWFAVDVTLDPDTAHPELILSPDGKQVTCCDPNGNLTYRWKKFQLELRVLGKQGFSHGRFYFEVQVKGKTEWTLGVAKESVNRRMSIKPTPQSGYWSISLRNATEVRALSDPAVRLSLQSGPEKVGVFVDYDDGLVFFYDVEAAHFIYSFTGCLFNDRIYPFFDLSYNDAAPLIISPISHTD